ncbi:MAG: protein DpdE [Rhodococcus sp.]|nr:protein DpdE [Rhodococcus sp. (in: high G+C Gram-positive bacteria)]
MINGSKPASGYVGKWLLVRSYPDFGFGYCTGIRGGKCVISFVDVPRVLEHEVVVATEDLVESPIPIGTRVWVRGDPYGWHAGVIRSLTTADRYRVTLAGIPRPVLLYQDQFAMRWSNPLEDPAVAVAHGLTEVPTYYEARSELLAEFVRQRQVSRGLAAAISAPINLYQHQVDTAARVLADPVMRYLLADEVGLGKTIEAGLVVRQMLIDDSNARVLVLCPKTLVGQWIAELRDRLGLEVPLREFRIRVAVHADILEVGRLDQFAIVIVDEAHNFLHHVPPDSKIEGELREAKALLALSATPMRGDTDTFRRLLALVDPVAFGDTTPEAFRARLEERERSAGDVQVLAARRASLRQKTAALDSLLVDFPEDPNIDALAVLCREVADPLAPAWGQLAEYVREIYRLSRRMIRHRRNDAVTASYAVAGRRPTFVEVSDPARPLIDEFLELYRLRLEDIGAATLFAEAVLFALAGPVAFRSFLERMLRTAGENGSGTVDDWQLFEATRARLDMVGLDTRLLTALEVVCERVEDGRKVVVASSFGPVARRFNELLRGRLGKYQVHCHLGEMTPRELDDAVAYFLGGHSGSALVVDTSMEEGRNLQAAEVLVNLDLPLDSSRLDQRIGRLDRYAARADPAEVVVLVEPASEWVSAHIRLLHEGIGVFDSSVSTVQRLLASVLESLIESLVAKGLEAFEVDVIDLRDALEAERDSIDLLEELESVGAATVFSDDVFAELLEYEDDTRNLRNAMWRLSIGRGALALTPSESKEGVVRFGSAKDIGLATDEEAILDRLLQPKAYDRRVTLERSGVAPFRIGDALVDWLERYLITDERGRASAVVRPVTGPKMPAVWLRSEFLIEFNGHQVFDADDPSRHRFIRRGNGLMGPLRIVTWTDTSGAAPKELVDDVLALPFDPSCDEVLRGRLWKQILDVFPAWAHICKESAEVARELVSDSAELRMAVQSAVGSAERDIARRSAILEARALRLPTGQERAASRQELKLEQEVGKALLAGILVPSIRMVACGVFVLWPEEYR